MSTSTLINKLDETADGVMAKSSYEYFTAAAAITAGQVVSLDFAQTDGARAQNVKPADAADTDIASPVGIAMHAAASGEDVKVCVAGYCEGAVVSTSTTKGDLLQIGATAGELDVRTTAVDEGGSATFNLLQIVAQAMEDDTAGVADVWVYRLYT